MNAFVWSNSARIGLFSAVFQSIFTSLTTIEKIKKLDMKITTKNLLVHLDKNELNRLTEQVKETICLDLNSSPKKKQFTVAELSKIQGSKRVQLIGRRYL